MPRLLGPAAVPLRPATALGDKGARLAGGPKKKRPHTPTTGPGAEQNRSKVQGVWTGLSGDGEPDHPPGFSHPLKRARPGPRSANRCFHPAGRFVTDVRDSWRRALATCICSRTYLEGLAEWGQRGIWGAERGQGISSPERACVTTQGEAPVLAACVCVCSRCGEALGGIKGFLLLTKPRRDEENNLPGAKASAGSGPGGGRSEGLRSPPWFKK